MPITPQGYYTLLLKTFRGNGIKIIHRKLKKAGGLYCQTKDLITISSEYKNTLVGCYLLCHEKIHRDQRRNNEFPEFFKMRGKQSFNEELYRIVIDAEMDAVKRANLTLKMFGIPFSPPELTKEGYEHAINFWKNYYFK
jgi:hypothetical protein